MTTFIWVLSLVILAVIAGFVLLKMKKTKKVPEKVTDNGNKPYYRIPQNTTPTPYSYSATYKYGTTKPIRREGPRKRYEDESYPTAAYGAEPVDLDFNGTPDLYEAYSSADDNSYSAPDTSSTPDSSDYSSGSSSSDYGSSSSSSDYGSSSSSSDYSSGSSSSD